MVWFECTDCGESLKKPKVQSHTYSCSASAFNCIDCGRTFDIYTVKEHTTCVTEHDKYAKGATKPGGYAASGFFGSGETAKPQDASGAAGLEFLSSRPPWKCSICNVSCTSQETLMGHASGAKHKRRAKAASKQADGQSAEAAGTDATPATAPDPVPAEDPAPAEHVASKAGEPEQNGTSKKDRKPKRKGEAAAEGAAPSDDSAAPELKQPKMKKRKDKAPEALMNGHSAEGELDYKDKSASAGVPNGHSAAAVAEDSKAPSWTKMAKQILQNCEGHSMKMSKLQRKVLAAAGLPKDALAEHQQAIAQKLASKKKTFTIVDGEVSLREA